MKARAAALSAGALFGVGLGVSGMTLPPKVRGFLDVGGDWDPSLAFVMLGAIGVHLALLRATRARVAPVFHQMFHPPTTARIDAPLLAGAAVFGVGWGLGGVCPGPAIVHLGAGGASAWTFVLAMVAGMALHGAARRALAPRPPLRAEQADTP